MREQRTSHHRLRAVVLIAALVSTALTAAALIGLSTSPAQATSAPAAAPIVVGNQLRDAHTGRSWAAHGVNWPSFEYACVQGWGYSGGGATAAAAAAIRSWGATFVRLPLNEECWLGTDGQPSSGGAAGYRAAVASWVQTLNAAGLVVDLDLHWAAPAGYAADGQRAMPDARSVTFWSQLATAYRANPSVIFEAYNEPYSRWNSATNSWALSLSWSCWRDGGCQAPVENDQSSALSGQTYPVVGMAALVSAIRAAGATQPVLLGGLDYSNDLRGWLANRPADSQLVAAWHNYPGQRCDTQSCWSAEVTPVAAQVPVVASEFGEDDGGSGFLGSFMSWADAHGVGYAPWAWWAVSASESASGAAYALITDTTSFTPKAPSGTTYHAHLAALGGGVVTPTPTPTVTPAPTVTPTPVPSSPPPSQAPTPPPAPAPAPSSSFTPTQPVPQPPTQPTASPAPAPTTAPPASTPSNQRCRIVLVHRHRVLRCTVVRASSVAKRVTHSTARRR